MRKEKWTGAKQPDGKRKELEVEGERTQPEREATEMARKMWLAKARDTGTPASPRHHIPPGSASSEKFWAWCSEDRDWEGWRLGYGESLSTLWLCPGPPEESAEEMILQAAGVDKKKVRGQPKAYEFRSSGTNVP